MEIKGKGFWNTFDTKLKDLSKTSDEDIYDLDLTIKEGITLDYNNEATKMTNICFTRLSLCTCATCATCNNCK